MADETYQPKIYMTEGGDQMDVKSGGKITKDGAQAAAIADATTNYSAATLTDYTTTATAINGANTKINSIIAALEGVGILAP